MIEELPPVEPSQGTPQEAPEAEARMEPEAEPHLEEPDLEEPAPEPAPAKPAPKAKAQAKAAPGRPKKQPGEPKAKYTPRKPQAPKEVPVVREVIREPIDEARLARQVITNIGELSRNYHEARRDGWRDLIARNYQ